MKENIKVNKINKDLQIIYNDKKILVNQAELKEKKYIFLDKIKKHIDIQRVEVEGSKYYIYCKPNLKLYITTDPNIYYNIKQNFIMFKFAYTIFFIGRITHIEKRISEFKNVYIDNKKVSEIKRFKYLKRFGYININIKKIGEIKKIHNTLMIGQSIETAIPFKYNRNSKGIYFSKKLNNNYIILRNKVNTKSLVLTCVKYDEEFKLINLLKNKIAYILSRFIKKDDIILLFEKESFKADESGYCVFDKIVENSNIKSKVFFVIDKKSPDYDRVINKHKKNILKKYSFKHYLYIYLSSYFISSELSNHVLNTRIFNEKLNECIRKKPAIFLQHGIMFAKPIDNPAARDFYKKNLKINIIKSVVSSELEASQFYKAGYNESDLIKCGLPKFDKSKLNDDASKIMYMLTYRYWEERECLTDVYIHNTSYYKAYERVIEKFEKEGLIDRLILSAHPKVAGVLKKAFPLYENLIETNIDVAISKSKIFITDFSSASYDAHYRGAYIIYDWTEKEYLIKKYKAIPPINEKNCDGVPVFNVDDLIKEVKIAIENNYVLEEKYQNRYSKINEFNDNKNSERLIKELQNLNILK